MALGYAQCERRKRFAANWAEVTRYRRHFLTNRRLCNGEGISEFKKWRCAARKNGAGGRNTFLAGSNAKPPARQSDSPKSGLSTLTVLPELDPGDREQLSA